MFAHNWYRLTRVKVINIEFVWTQSGVVLFSLSVIEGVVFAKMTPSISCLFYNLKSIIEYKYTSTARVNIFLSFKILTAACCISSTQNNFGWFNSIINASILPSVYRNILKWRHRDISARKKLRNNFHNLCHVFLFVDFIHERM